MPTNIIYGIHSVMAVLEYKPKRAQNLYVADIKNREPILELARRARIPYVSMGKDELLERFSLPDGHQGVVLQCGPFPYAALEDMLENPNVNRLLLLDGIQDPMNLGRMIRSALCLGAHAVIINKNRCAPVTASCEKAAVGATSRLPIIQVANLGYAIDKLKSAHFFIYGAHEQGQTLLKECDFAPKTAIVIGAEGEGLRDLTKKSCDFLVRIPMAEKDICLNAADAALLFLYELENKKASGAL